jgi:ADP-heptose:LPS heptosyltransferase
MATKRKRTSRRPAKKQARHRTTDCKHFTGYKPCFPDTRCYEECVDFDPIGKKILIINLDAMGNVLVTTTLLPAIKRKYPTSHISWITLKNAYRLLDNNPYLDKVYVWEPESWLILQQLDFDVVMNIDKSQRSGAFTMSLNAKEKLGFGLNKNGAIVPLNKEAGENYRLGLDDHLKFKVNRKTVSQILHETMKLKYMRDEYVLELSPAELAFCRQYRKSVGIRDEEVVVGFNTGCSDLYPNKKMTIEQHVELIRRMASMPGVKLALVGGPEDTLRNAEIVRQVGDMVINTPTTEGVRRGLCYESICDVIVSGDSFGMHAAIGLRKHVIAWFGVTSAREVDLFERGMKLIPEGLECSPCWKRECPYNLECISMVDLDAIVSYVETHRTALLRYRMEVDAHKHEPV